jgi:hypothetical protein
MASEEILTVLLVSKDGGDYCVRCPHCGDIIGVDGQDLSEIRGEQFHHKRREYPGPAGPRYNGCGSWLEVGSSARFVRELPEHAPGMRGGEHDRN